MDPSKAIQEFFSYCGDETHITDSQQGSGSLAGESSAAATHPKTSNFLYKEIRSIVEELVTVVIQPEIFLYQEVYHIVEEIVGRATHSDEFTDSFADNSKKELCLGTGSSPKIELKGIVLQVDEDMEVQELICKPILFDDKNPVPTIITNRNITPLPYIANMAYDMLKSAASLAYQSTLPKESICSKIYEDIENVDPCSLLGVVDSTDLENDSKCASVKPNSKFIIPPFTDSSYGCDNKIYGSKYMARAIAALKETKLTISHPAASSRSPGTNKRNAECSSPSSLDIKHTAKKSSNASTLLNTTSDEKLNDQSSDSKSRPDPSTARSHQLIPGKETNISTCTDDKLSPKRKIIKGLRHANSRKNTDKEIDSHASFTQNLSHMPCSSQTVIDCDTDLKQAYGNPAVNVFKRHLESVVKHQALKQRKTETEQYYSDVLVPQSPKRPEDIFNSRNPRLNLMKGEDPKQWFMYDDNFLYKEMRSILEELVVVVTKPDVSIYQEIYHIVENIVGRATHHNQFIDSFKYNSKEEWYVGTDSTPNIELKGVHLQLKDDMEKQKQICEPVLFNDKTTVPTTIANFTPVSHTANMADEILESSDKISEPVSAASQVYQSPLPKEDVENIDPKCFLFGAVDSIDIQNDTNYASVEQNSKFIIPPFTDSACGRDNKTYDGKYMARAIAALKETKSTISQPAASSKSLDINNGNSEGSSSSDLEIKTIQQRMLSMVNTTSNEKRNEQPSASKSRPDPINTKIGSTATSHQLVLEKETNISTCTDRKSIKGQRHADPRKISYKEKDTNASLTKKITNIPCSSKTVIDSDRELKKTHGNTAVNISKRHLESVVKQEAPKRRKTETEQGRSNALVSRRQKLPDDISDLKNPRWRLMRRKDPKECFNFVRSQWKLEHLVNPHINLTCRFVKRSYTPATYTIPGSRRNPNIPCTAIYDKRIRAVQDSIDEIRREILFLNDYHRRSYRYMSRKERARVTYLTQNRNHFENKLRKLYYARKFIIFFYKFYKDNSNHFNANYLTEQQVNEIEYHYNILKGFRDFYSRAS